MSAPEPSPFSTRFDARARRWPRPLYWLFLGVKWYLALAGAFAVLMYLLHRLGLPSLWVG